MEYLDIKKTTEKTIILGGLKKEKRYVGSLCVHYGKCNSVYFKDVTFRSTLHGTFVMNWNLKARSHISL